MFRKLPALICILAGLWCLLAISDARGWMQPVWQRVLPRTMLPRMPSQSELRAEQLKAEVAALQRELTDVTALRGQVEHRRLERLEQLTAHLRELPLAARPYAFEEDDKEPAAKASWWGRRADPARWEEWLGRLAGKRGAPQGAGADTVEQLLEDRPVLAALVRAIDAEDRRGAELEARHGRLAAELARLEARWIDLESQAGLVMPPQQARPSDGLRWTQERPTTRRHEQILREAMDFGTSTKGSHDDDP